MILVFVCSFLAASGAPARKKRAVPVVCNEPPNLSSLYSSLDNGTSHDIFTKATNVLRSSNHMLTNCPKSIPTSGDVNDRSLCPWYYEINEDPMRYPAVIPEARCKCEYCLEVTGKKCENVNYNIRVLKRSSEICDADGYYQYKEVYVSIRVGCTCAGSAITTVPSTDAGTAAEKVAQETDVATPEYEG